MNADASKGTAHEGFEVPGTLVLALAFLALFMLLYAISWYELSSIPWGIR